MIYTDNRNEASDFLDYGTNTFSHHSMNRGHWSFQQENQLTCNLQLHCGLSLSLYEKWNFQWRQFISPIAKCVSNLSQFHMVATLVMFISNFLISFTEVLFFSNFLISFRESSPKAKLAASIGRHHLKLSSLRYPPSAVHKHT
uniref:Uncharacterized protein n=1 Tax=Glossina pallidipes TaxID=7398 RepID=A0A1A9ZAE8_GLOPL